MRALALVFLLAGPIRAAVIESRPVEIRPVIVNQLGALIGTRVNFGFQAINPPEIELANLEALMIRRDETPGGTARAEAARLLAGYMAHPAQLERQKAALSLELGRVRVEYLQRAAAALHKKAAERPVLAERLRELSARVAPPEKGIDGAAERMNVLFDGWTEKWDDSALSAVPGTFATQHYTLSKPDGRVAERRTIQVPKGDRRRPNEPFMAGVSALHRRADKLLRAFRVGEDRSEPSDWRLMGGTLAAGAALFGMLGVFFGVPVSWKLMLFAPGAMAAVLAGRALAWRSAEKAAWLLHGVEPKTGKRLTSPEAGDKLWDAREKAETRGGVAAAVGLTVALLGLGWLLLAPELATAWVSSALGTAVGVHPPLWSYLAALGGSGTGFALMGWAWGQDRVKTLAETSAELVALDGARHPIVETDEPLD